MEVRGISKHALEKALEWINREFEENITFNNFQQLGKYRFRVTLRVKDAKGPGHRISTSGRRMINACWHVYGQYIEILVYGFGAKVKTVLGTITPDNVDDLWSLDKNIGSLLKPMMLSEACECKDWALLHALESW